MIYEKLKIIQDAEEIVNCSAGKEYDISKSCIRDWRKEKLLM
jgi:hypothetical protein